MRAKIPENWETRCIVCYEVITHPICIDCLEKEVIQLLMPNDPAFVPLIKGISEFFRNGEGEKKTTCILCGKKMNICTHCYKNEIYDLLMQSDLGLAEEFKEGFFDYEIGFTKEAS